MGDRTWLGWSGGGRVGDGLELPGEVGGIGGEVRIDWPVPDRLPWADARGWNDLSQRRGGGGAFRLGFEIGRKAHPSKRSRAANPQCGALGTGPAPPPAVAPSRATAGPLGTPLAQPSPFSRRALHVPRSAADTDVVSLFHYSGDTPYFHERAAELNLPARPLRGRRRRCDRVE